MIFKCTINNITKPDFEIYLDETKIVDFQHVSNKIYINCELSKGTHYLKIVRNKEVDIKKSFTKKYKLIYVNKISYNLKFDINKDCFLELNHISKKIELEKNHIHWQVFKSDRKNVKILKETLSFDDVCDIVKKYEKKILLKDVAFVTAFILMTFFVILTMLHEFSKYGIALIYLIFVFSGFGLYYFIKLLIKYHKYHTLIKEIKANKEDCSTDLLDWFIYDGRWGFRD